MNETEQKVGIITTRPSRLENLLNEEPSKTKFVYKRIDSVSSKKGIQRKIFKILKSEV